MNEVKRYQKLLNDVDLDPCADEYADFVLASDYNSLAAECERLRADAERYRWLRVHSTGPVEPWSTHSCPESLDQIVDISIAAHRAKSLDSPE